MLQIRNRVHEEKLMEYSNSGRSRSYSEFLINSVIPISYSTVSPHFSITPFPSTETTLCTQRFKPYAAADCHSPRKLDRTRISLILTCRGQERELGCPSQTKTLSTRLRGSLNLYTCIYEHMNRKNTYSIVLRGIRISSLKSLIYSFKHLNYISVKLEKKRSTLFQMQM